MDWLIWLCVAAGLAILELLSLDLVLLMLAGGALAATIVAIPSGSVVVEAVVAIVVSAGMLSLVRPSLVERLHRGSPELRIGPDRLVGKRAEVTTSISTDHPGQVIIAGEQWTAAPYDETLVIAPGSTVEVLAIRGATAYVHPLPKEIF
ncbi:NfeD family protein [Nocardioides sp. BP30]|uniref:NfeD family protein n=1 Tax=Nocardioides sp. BP30 TaxID=3036374 RepID=UPI0024683AD3|nr:NfeD family protein [Nocardioides sp. BP30]WGL50861.1 NfeD family protein [Nocardioides sp. BP30]